MLPPVSLYIHICYPIPNVGIYTVSLPLNCTASTPEMQSCERAGGRGQIAATFHRDSGRPAHRRSSDPHSAGWIHERAICRHCCVVCAVGLDSPDHPNVRCLGRHTAPGLCAQSQIVTELFSEIRSRHNCVTVLTESVLGAYQIDPKGPLLQLRHILIPVGIIPASVVSFRLTLRSSCHHARTGAGVRGSRRVGAWLDCVHLLLGESRCSTSVPQTFDP